jgi:hypothetical protein
MLAIGFGLGLVGYAGVMLGYCWLRDYNVTFTGLFRATWPGVSAAGPGTVSSQVVPTPTGQPSGPSTLTGQ